MPLVKRNCRDGTYRRLIALIAVLLQAIPCSAPAQQNTNTDSFVPPPADGTGKSLATKWPILLSHAFSVTAATSFRGDVLGRGGQFDTFGVKTALEQGGAIVYQPNKIAYGSHETRGRLLYKKCAGSTLKEMLCEGDHPVVVDGLYQATLDYCSSAIKRARSGFSSELACRKGLQFNIICHSQGCADSRYMLAAVRNEFSGDLLYKHVASWTSLAGANKGSAEADWFLQATAACFQLGCRSTLINLILGVQASLQDGQIVANAADSVVALSRKYMLITTDMNCTPSPKKSCPPSFNQLYPLPVDPNHPILYQTFSSQIFDLSHPCYRPLRLLWSIVNAAEGPNDGNISVDSQRFTTYGPGESGPRTPVVARWISGYSSNPSKPHPGLSHMAYSDSEVPGLDNGGLSCAGEDNSDLRFSRVGLYRDIVAELTERGY